MSMRNFLLLLPLLAQSVYADRYQSPHLGQPAGKALVKQWNRDIFPNGKGLPEGNGTAKSGKKVYQTHCQVCHGVEGNGDSAGELAGAMHSLTDPPPIKRSAPIGPMPPRFLISPVVPCR